MLMGRTFIIACFTKAKIQIIKKQVPYSQHSIFFVTYESAQKARLFHNTKLERLTSAKHCNLLGLFISYIENKVL
jgi:hypothetical protein